MIKAIIFDIGGVLMDLDMERCLRTFREEAGFMRIGEILDPCHQKGIISDLEEGLITEDEFITEILKECPEGTSADTIRRSFCSLLHSVAPDKVAFINELKQNYDLYLLSNNNPITMVRSAERFAEAGAPLSIFKEIFICFLCINIFHDVIL